jgi:Transposase DDE domain group 1
MCASISGGAEPAGPSPGAGPGLDRPRRAHWLGATRVAAAGKTISEVVIDLDATLVAAHSDQEDARAPFKGGFGHHPLGAWLDNTNEALAMLCARATRAATPPPIT